MLAEFIDKLEALVIDARTVDVQTIKDKGTYTDRPLLPLYSPPIIVPLPIEIHTLTGLLDYLRDNRDKLDLARLTVHVVSPERVRLVDKLEGEHAQRRIYVETSWVTGQGPSSFAFGTWHAADFAVISLLSLFEPTEARDGLVKVLGNLSANDVKQATDDGVSQQVTVRRGVSMAASVVVQPIQNLRPYRTFREFSQPESAFLLRLRAQGESLPQVALFEADGGRWRLEAIEEIAQYLTVGLKDAGVDVAVLA